MTDLLKLIFGILASRFKARATLEGEKLVVGPEVNVLGGRTAKRPHLSNADRFLFVWLYRWFPSVLEVVAIVRPETIIRWHRAGFRAYWRWRSRNRVGRPKVSAELRTLIGEMSRANALWGAPRIHGELLKLGFEVAQSTVARYMCRHSRPPSQGWRTFLSNHADGIAGDDRFVLPTIAFQILYCLVIVRHGRRLRVSFGVTANPTAEWISRQVTEAFPWDHAPRYLIRDRDTSYGPVFLHRIRAMGIRDHPIAPRSPWQNAYVERLIASIRRECLDHMIVFVEAHLRRTLRGYAAYYNVSRTHRALNKVTPLRRAIECLGVPSSHDLSLAAFTINIAESNFRHTHRSRAPSNGPEAFFVAQFSAGYTTNMFGFDLRHEQVGLAICLLPQMRNIYKTSLQVCIPPGFCGRWCVVG